MREALKPFENVRFTYIATFKRFGINFVSGEKYRTALLLDVKNSFGDYICDHLWLRDLNQIVKLNLKSGDKIMFSAVVKKYQHGHIKEKIGEKEDKCNYTFKYLKNVKKIL